MADDQTTGDWNTHKAMIETALEAVNALLLDGRATVMADFNPHAWDTRYAELPLPNMLLRSAGESLTGFLGVHLDNSRQQLVVVASSIRKSKVVQSEPTSEALMAALREATQWWLEHQPDTPTEPAPPDTQPAEPATLDAAPEAPPPDPQPAEPAPDILPADTPPPHAPLSEEPQTESPPEPQEAIQLSTPLVWDECKAMIQTALETVRDALLDGRPEVAADFVPEATAAGFGTLKQSNLTLQPNEFAWYSRDSISTGFLGVSIGRDGKRLAITASNTRQSKLLLCEPTADALVDRLHEAAQWWLSHQPDKWGTARRSPAASSEAYEKLGGQHPLITIWLHPRETIRLILDTNPEQGVLALAMLAGILGVLTPDYDLMATGTSSSPFAITSPFVLLVVVFGGALLGIVSIYFSAALLAWVGGWFGGQGTTLEMRAVITWGGIPSMALFAIHIAFSYLGLLVLGPSEGLFWLLFILQLPFSIGIYIAYYLPCLAEAHQFSRWAAFGVSLIIGFIALVAVMVIVFGFLFCTLGTLWLNYL